MNQVITVLALACSLPVSVAARADDNTAPLAAPVTHAALQPAAPAASGSTPTFGGFRIIVEDDFLPLGSAGSDRNYTFGLRLETYYNGEGGHAGSLAHWVRHNDWQGWPAKLMGLGPGKAEVLSSGMAIGQETYTPQVITFAKRIKDDRPYAGLLYWSPFANFVDRGGTRLQALDLQFGWVGPEALGGDLQSFLHSVVGNHFPLGWKNQLHFEPIVNGSYLSAYRIIPGDRRGQDGNSERISQNRVSTDIVPHWGFAVGNLFTGARMGGMIRVGQNIRGFPTPISAATWKGEGQPAWSWNVYAGAEGRLVARNIFLDGNTFTGSQRVRKLPGVYDLKWGFQVTHKNWQFTYTTTRRSEEFTPRPKTMNPTQVEQDFGSISLAVNQRF